MANTTLNSEYIADRYVANNTSCFRLVALLCSAREVLQKRLPSIETERHMGRSLQYSARHSYKALYPTAPHTQNERDSRTMQKISTSPNTKNFPQEHPPYTKRNKSSLCMGGCSWGKFGVGQGGLEGRETPPKGVSLRLQGLPHLTPRKLQPTSGTRRGRNGGQDQDRVTLREPSHRSPICRRGDTCCCGEASSAPERRT